MASVASNLVTPQQAAINNKLNPSPFGYTSGPAVSPLASSYGMSATTPATTPHAVIPTAPATTTPTAGLVSTPKPVTQGVPSSYAGPSIVDYLGSTGQASDYNSRAQLAASKGIQGYTGSAEQNTQLLNLLRGNGTSAPAPVTQASGTTGLVPPPQTGGTTTSAPAGAGAGTPPPPPVDFSSLIQSLGTQSLANNPNYQTQLDAYQKAVADASKIQQDYNSGVANIESSGIPTQYAQGREGLLQRLASSNLSAAQSRATAAQQGIGFAQQGQSLQQQALQQAASLAQPQLASYSQQSFNPLNQQFSGGGSLNDAVSSVAQKVQNGQMTYNDALNALTGYGQGGINALQQALGPNFNVAQSNTLAGQQGSIGPAYSYAKTAITNLQNAVQGLSSTQNTNIPIINMITQGLSTAFGPGAQGVQAYKGALAEARSAIQKVLASVQGGTPTDYVGQSNALLPDNATPAQIAAASQTLDTLGQAKVNIYGNPGNSSNTVPTMNGGSLYDF